MATHTGRWTNKPTVHGNGPKSPWSFPSLMSLSITELDVLSVNRALRHGILMRTHFCGSQIGRDQFQHDQRCCAFYFISKMPTSHLTQAGRSWCLFGISPRELNPPIANLHGVLGAACKTAQSHYPRSLACPRTHCIQNPVAPVQWQSLQFGFPAPLPIYWPIAAGIYAHHQPALSALNIILC